MILVCPSCDTRYFADDASVGKEGRRVRCASCGHSWFAKVQEDGDLAAAAETGLTREQVERLRQTAAANSASRGGPHSEYRAREHAKRKRHRLLATAAGWASGVVVFAAFAGTAVALRNQVVETWPKAASIYRAVGLSVNRFGLELVNVTAKRSFDGTTPVLTVSGSALNPSKARRPSPGIRVSLRNEAGKEIHAWTDKLAVPAIGPGESIAFSSRIVAPPLETFGLSVTFAAAAGGPAETAAAAVGHDQIEGGDRAPKGAKPAKIVASGSSGEGGAKAVGASSVDKIANDSDGALAAHPVAQETTHR